MSSEHNFDSGSIQSIGNDVKTLSITDIVPDRWVVLVAGGNFGPDTRDIFNINE